ncbi:divisome protein SepX/GlpR [Streptomyces meridianus]|uniref:Uncharacterized protein n=1 Tax=Streptomyces meridianus TaxID=2938945 RepID=A0ABT0X9V8_9ACTN|nr:gephyrin-like molybdotransferase receptor GlpR [Streptomyces meridianus]MCM2579075.1 hypothetical protein [Streptomyces meridianus]
MSSSGLIYAVIVGAWAAYLVPMWLRRQDELNEARPTERFSTAIRLLSGRAGMERRYAKELDERYAGEAEALGDGGPADPDDGTTGPDVVTDSVDVRSFAVSASADAPCPDGAEAPADAPPSRTPARPGHTGAERRARSKVLARRRRTTMVLFLAFTLGAIVAAVGGLAFLWAPVVPALLLSAYIVHLRAQERRRFAFTMDQRRAEAAAQRLRERDRRTRQEVRDPGGENDTVRAPAPDPEMVTVRVPAPASPHAAGRRALVEQTDHAEWVDQQRERRPADGESWEPVPVPLPTYVTAPVAPRAAARVDLEAGDAWSSARSGSAEPAVDLPEQAAGPGGASAERRPRERGRTPLFDQYADEDRPRAANE